MQYESIQMRWRQSALVLSVLFLRPVLAGPEDPAANRPIPSFTIPAVRAGVSYERFMVIGDMGTGNDDQRAVAAAMAKRAKSDGLDFLLTVGDNFYPMGVRSADDPQWKSKFEDIYSDAALRVPIFPTLGNHDHYGDPLAQVEYAKRNPNWRMPAQYYSFLRELTDGVEVAFFAIDTDPIHNKKPEAEAQLRRLEEELSKSRGRWKIVFGHHPLYSHGRHGKDQVMIDRLEPLLTRHRVDVYFCGHDHTLEMLKPIAGVHHVISGGGGGPEKAYGVDWTDESYYAATLGGFVLCRISKDELVIEFVRLDGSTQYAHVIEKSDRPG